MENHPSLEQDEEHYRSPMNQVSCKLGFPPGEIQLYLPTIILLCYMSLARICGWFFGLAILLTKRIQWKVILRLPWDVFSIVLK